MDVIYLVHCFTKYGPSTGSDTTDGIQSDLRPYLMNSFSLKYSRFTVLCQFQMHSTVIQLHALMCSLFQILFPYKLLQNSYYISMCYTVGPCWLSIL